MPDDDRPLREIYAEQTGRYVTDIHDREQIDAFVSWMREYMNLHSIPGNLVKEISDRDPKLAKALETLMRKYGYRYVEKYGEWWKGMWKH